MSEFIISHSVQAIPHPYRINNISLEVYFLSIIGDLLVKILSQNQISNKQQLKALINEKLNTIHHGYDYPFHIYELQNHGNPHFPNFYLTFYPANISHISFLLLSRNIAPLQNLASLRIANLVSNSNGLNEISDHFHLPPIIRDLIQQFLN